MFYERQIYLAALEPKEQSIWCVIVRISKSNYQVILGCFTENKANNFEDIKA